MKGIQVPRTESKERTTNGRRDKDETRTYIQSTLGEYKEIQRKKKNI